jgi:hypothetical protein
MNYKKLMLKTKRHLILSRNYTVKIVVIALSNKNVKALRKWQLFTTKTKFVKRYKKIGLKP